MTVKIEQARLLECLKKVQAAANGKMLNGILGNVKISAKGDKASFTTTNLDITLHCVTESSVGEAGTTLIPMGLLFTAVSRLAGGEVTISDEGEKIVVSCGRASYRFAKRNVEEFPKFSEEEVKYGFTIPAAKLSDLLKKTAYAQSNDVTRSTLKSVMMAIEGGRIRCVATDGKRLAISEDEIVADNPSEAISVIIPTIGISVLQKFVDKKEDIRVGVMGTKVKFSDEKAGDQFYTKVVDGMYPDYIQVVPKSHKTTAVIDRNELISSIDRVSVMAITDTNSVKMTFADNRLLVEVNGDESGMANDEFPIKYDGEKIEIRFNPKYVLDPVKSSNSDEIVFEMNDGKSPAVIKSSEERFQCVIMPLRLN